MKCADAAAGEIRDGTHIDDQVVFVIRSDSVNIWIE